MFIIDWMAFFALIFDSLVTEWPFVGVLWTGLMDDVSLLSWSGLAISWCSLSSIRSSHFESKGLFWLTMDFWSNGSQTCMKNK